MKRNKCMWYFSQKNLEKYFQMQISSFVQTILFPTAPATLPGWQSNFWMLTYPDKLLDWFDKNFILQKKVFCF